MVCTEMEDLADFCVPSAPAALLKCALLSIGIVSFDKARPRSGGGGGGGGGALHTTTLAEQLDACPGLGAKGRRGLEIRSWSNLPKGSGLGTSSILAAALIAAAGRGAGIHLTNETIVHAVMLAEQLLTTLSLSFSLSLSLSFFLCLSLSLSFSFSFSRAP